MPGDLHTHTTFSDGSTPADKLPFLAACAGMTHLAISDHDSIRSVRYAYAHPVQNGVHLIPATELTAYDYERAHRVHLLCYWPDDCPALEDFSRMMAERETILPARLRSSERIRSSFLVSSVLMPVCMLVTMERARSSSRPLWTSVLRSPAAAVRRSSALMRATSTRAL